MSFLDFAAIKQQVSIRSAIDLLGSETDRASKPVARRRVQSASQAATARWSSRHRKNAFYCFAAHSGGDVIALASHIRRSRHERGRRVSGRGQRRRRQRHSSREPAMVTTSSPRRGPKRTSEASSLSAISIQIMKPFGPSAWKGRPAAISAQAMRQKASCAESSPFQSMIGEQASLLPIADMA